MPPALSIGELFILGFKGFTVPKWLRSFAESFALGGVILFDYDVGAGRHERNVRDPGQVQSLCGEISGLASNPLIFVDQEGGKVRRLKESLGFAPLPSAHDFNRLPPADKTAIILRSYQEMKGLGISFNLAPVIDLNLNPCNPDIGGVLRAYSHRAGEVRANVAILNEAARATGLGLCLKHYPGMGGAVTNSHHELTDIGSTLNEAQIKLFHDLAPTLHGQAILVSHGIVNQWEPGLPVSMCAAALRALRNHVPEALLISDDLQMQGLQMTMNTRNACMKGLGAGLDMLLIGNNLMDESKTLPEIANDLAETAQADATLSGRVKDAVLRVQSRKRLLRISDEIV